MWLKSVRWVTLVLGVSNIVVIILGALIVFLAFPACRRSGILPFAFIWVAAAMRIVAMVRTGVAQEATAMTIIGSPTSATVDPVVRQERRMRYKRWLWWTRFAAVIMILQFGGACYLMFKVAKCLSHDGASTNCVLGVFLNGEWWKQKILVAFLIMVCFVALVQCFTGSDVLKWRSFYATQDSAWKSHYREVFDHGIREALCCLGRAKYLSELEEDEVYSVARLLGDLVAYRASGTGHLELLAGLALLQRRSQSPRSYEGCVEVSEEQMQQAVALHQFAEAAYTGPLLDFGRHPVLFPCAWLYRQGILTSWTRNRRPVLEGDNWWRGHAAAFLKYVNLSPEVLRRGRVSQGKCEATYFIVVLHHLRSVVIAVRGTETPEDLITDSLCRECILSEEDLDGLINSSCICPNVRKSVVSSFPHYAHSGIVGAARDLFMQIDGNPGDNGGFLSSLMGVGCECEGYNIRIVGHSLGGAIGALLGLRLYGRYPNLHVYTYGSLPCVDSVIADASSKFVTSIVYHNEFSARLSVRSILRLRAAAIKALSEDSRTDTAMIFRLARRFLYVSKLEGSTIEEKDPASDLHSATVEDMHLDAFKRPFPDERLRTSTPRVQDEEFSIWKEADMKDSSDYIDSDDSLDEFTNPFHETAANVISFDNPVSQFMEAVPSSGNGSAGDPIEMFLPGLIVHIVPQERSFHMHLWRGWRVQEHAQGYKAYIVNRENFKDIIVSPSMFLDHLPWRCHYAMQKVLENRTVHSLLDVPQLV
ncbi:uncharacterized protein LOC131152103 [Malania oleifera]|uniref:uncharacterized protein LOC131152103 n=1 Tax=Malania oleifera TaxID=397392 RepID=UPI0025ADF72A|nr:uncharacterized protein LOC131152103 [Malania oleifera]